MTEPRRGGRSGGITCTAFPLPNCHSSIVNGQSGKRNPCCAWSKSSLRSVEICRLRLQTMKPRNLFGFGASFTLAAIYSRGTYRPTTIDVLMFHFRVRNGTGWDHQAMTTRFQEAVFSASCLSGCHLRLRVAVVCAGCRLVGSRLTSAWLWVFAFSLSCTHSRLHLIQAEIACHRGGV